MSDEITIEGREYFSSKRASGLSGYSQDYIGQLARAGAIDARRIGGLWYIFMDSLEGYKNKAESRVQEPPKKIESIDSGTIISFEGKNYSSTPRAAEITGYSQDYVSQLARSGKILSRQIGNRWYVDKEALLSHKREKDALLAAVQSEAVGLKKSDPHSSQVKNLSYAGAGPFLNYVREEKDLMPLLGEQGLSSGDVLEMEKTTPPSVHEVPIRKVHPHNSLRSITRRRVSRHEIHREKKSGAMHGKTIFYGTFAAAALTIVIVLSFGFPSFKTGSLYTVNIPAIKNTLAAKAMTASVAESFGLISDTLERLIVPELVYKRTF